MTKLKRLLKRYEKARKKASTLYEKIVKALHNSQYGLTNYADTDSVKDNRGRSQNIIYSDFDKKREV